MRMMGVGLLMMAAGLITLFAMVVGALAPGLLLALAAYASSVTGLVLAGFGLIERIGLLRRR